MARPIKNNADYFPHDADTRNDPRVKAVRRKFSHEGYAIYLMVIEYLTDSDHFRAKTDKLNIELMAGDFDIETNRLLDILNYCVDIDLLQSEGDYISCRSLDKRLNPLLSKRERDRGTLSPAITTPNQVIASESTQSKVKYSKVNESTVDEITLSEFEKLLDDELWKDQLSANPAYKGKNLTEAIHKAHAFLSVEGRLKNGELKDFKKTVQAFMNNEKHTAQKKSTNDFLTEAFR